MNRYAAELAAALGERTNVQVIAPRSSREGRWRDGNIEIVEAYTRGSWLAPFEIFLGAMRSSTRLIHVQHELFAFGGLATALGLPLSLRVMRALGRRVVTTIHGVVPLSAITPTFVRSNGSRMPSAIARLGWRLLLRSVCSVSSVVIVHEERHQRVLREQYGVHVSIEVIPHGVAAPDALTSEERQAARRVLGIPVGAEVLTFFGYLAGYKGLPELLQTIPGLLEERPRLYVVFAGEVPERLATRASWRDRLAGLAAAEHRVRCLGFVPEEDVRAVFAVSDALILPYTSGISASGPLATALGYGTPALLSRFLEPNESRGAVSFDPTPEGIRLAVNDFFDDGRVRARAAAYAAELRGKRLWPTVAERTLAVYRSV